MTDLTWAPDAPGVLRLPSGRRVRGRGLRRALPAGPPPQFGLYLIGARPEATTWDSRWVRWRDFWLPADPDDLTDALREALERAATQRVELACGGGFGRTGTAMACLAILDGVAPGEAVAYVREHYTHRAVETPWQRRFVARFTADGARRP